MLELLRSGNASPEALEDLDTRLVAAPPSRTRRIRLPVGRELAALGKSEQAELYWLRASPILA